MGATLQKPLQDLSEEELAQAVAGIAPAYKTYQQALIENGVDGAVVASFHNQEELQHVLEHELGMEKKLHRVRLANEWFKAISIQNEPNNMDGGDTPYFDPVKVEEAREESDAENQQKPSEVKREGKREVRGPKNEPCFENSPQENIGPEPEWISSAANLKSEVTESNEDEAEEQIDPANITRGELKQSEEKREREEKPPEPNVKTEEVAEQAATDEPITDEPTTDELVGHPSVGNIKRERVPKRKNSGPETDQTSARETKKSKGAPEKESFGPEHEEHTVEGDAMFDLDALQPPHDSKKQNAVHLEASNKSKPDHLPVENMLGDTGIMVRRSKRSRWFLRKYGSRLLQTGWGGIPQHVVNQKIGEIKIRYYNGILQGKSAPQYVGQQIASVDSVPADGADKEFAVFMGRSLTPLHEYARCQQKQLGWEYVGNYKYVQSLDNHVFEKFDSGENFSPNGLKLYIRGIDRSSKSPSGHGPSEMQKWRERLIKELAKDPSPAGPQWMIDRTPSCSMKWMIDRRPRTAEERSQPKQSLAARARALGFYEDIPDNKLSGIIAMLDEYHVRYAIRFVRYDEAIYNLFVQKGGRNQVTAQKWYDFLDEQDLRASSYN